MIVTNEFAICSSQDTESVMLLRSTLQTEYGVIFPDLDQLDIPSSDKGRIIELVGERFLPDALSSLVALEHVAESKGFYYPDANDEKRRLMFNAAMRNRFGSVFENIHEHNPFRGHALGNIRTSIEELASLCSLNGQEGLAYGMMIDKRDLNNQYMGYNLKTRRVVHKPYHMLRTLEEKQPIVEAFRQEAVHILSFFGAVCNRSITPLVAEIFVE